MRVLILFMVVAFLIGGTHSGRRVRDRPILLVAFSTMTAASFYLLRVVM